MKTIPFILVSFTFFLFTPASQGTQIVKPDHITFTSFEQHAKEIKQNVFAVEIEGNRRNQDPNDDWRLLGTGFFVIGADDPVGLGLTFLDTRGVTCYHVVKPALAQQAQIYIGLELENKTYRRNKCEVVYKEPRHDVAVLKFAEISKDARTVETNVFRPSEFGDNSVLREGVGIIIPVYPLGLGTAAAKNHPVVRFGIVAQYTGQDTFLIDGMASHGSSGSPVWAPKVKRVIGMVTSHACDFIQLYDEHQRVVRTLPYNSGLGRAVTSEVITEILKEVFK